MKPGSTRLAHGCRPRSDLLWISCVAALTACGSPSSVTPPDSAGTPNLAAPDAGMPDAWMPDADTSDAGTSDAGTPDAGHPDAAVPDAGLPDSATSDAGLPDSATPDAGLPDSATPDARLPDAGPTPDAGPMPDAGTADGPMPDAGTPPAIASQTVTYTCVGTSCPWGDTASTVAIVWPASEPTVNTQLGYLVSPAMYLPGVRGNGADISIETGEADVFWGFPDEAALHWLATLGPGDTFHVDGIPVDSVLSVEADEPFTYRVTLPPSSDPGPGPGTRIQSTQGFWRCNLPGCDFPDWTGAVIDWPSWAAYHNNARSGDQSRSVFSGDGTPLYPYMGSWAQGCEVTAEAGVVQIIEWQRGTDVWRGTWLYPRQSHVIDLVSPEDGAMIETYDGSPGFSVSLRNCTPQPIAPSAAKPRRGRPSTSSAVPAHPGRRSRSHH